MLLEKSYGDVCARSTAGGKCREEKRFRSNRLFSRGFPRPRQKSSEITLARDSIRIVLTANQTRIFLTRSIRFYRCSYFLISRKISSSLYLFLTRLHSYYSFENFCTYKKRRRRMFLSYVNRNKEYL